MFRKIWGWNGIACDLNRRWHIFITVRFPCDDSMFVALRVLSMEYHPTPIILHLYIFIFLYFYNGYTYKKTKIFLWHCIRTYRYFFTKQQKAKKRSTMQFYACHFFVFAVRLKNVILRAFIFQSQTIENTNRNSFFSNKHTKNGERNSQWKIVSQNVLSHAKVCVFIFSHKKRNIFIFYWHCNYTYGYFSQTNKTQNTSKICNF